MGTISQVRWPTPSGFRENGGCRSPSRVARTRSMVLAGGGGDVSDLVFDEALSRQLEVLYATADVLRRRRLVHDALDVRVGERIVDVGCGPGFYVSEVLEQVGPTGFVVGIDASPAMRAVAPHRCQGHDNVEFHEAEATSLPLPAASVDGAMSVQVLEYVADPAAALAEMHRVVRPGGRVVIWDVDWATVSWYSRDPDRMARKCSRTASPQRSGRRMPTAPRSCPSSRTSLSDAKRHLRRRHRWLGKRTRTARPRRQAPGSLPFVETTYRLTSLVDLVLEQHRDAVEA